MNGATIIVGTTGRVKHFIQAEFVSLGMVSALLFPFSDTQLFSYASLFWMKQTEC